MVAGFAEVLCREEDWLRGADLNRRPHLRLIHTLCTITHQLLSCKNGYSDEYELLIAVENSGEMGHSEFGIPLAEGPMNVTLQQSVKISQNQFSAFLWLRGPKLLTVLG
jgi:hypothetical protein